MKQTIPKQMQASAIDRFGGIDTLRTQTLPTPEVAADEVLIKIDAAGVGVWDAFEREGGFAKMLGAEAKFPYVLGSDGAGTVAAVGKQAGDFKEGDRVYALALANPKGGFYAEYAAVKTNQVSLIPGNLTMDQAGAMPVDALTALEGLEDALGLKQGESLLIFGAGGGIGHLAVQLAKRMGARVLAVASGDDGVALAKRLGADATANGRRDDLTAAARTFAPGGLDAALLTAGGDVADRALSAVREGGRVAYPNGVMPEPKAPPKVRAKSYDGTPDPQSIRKLNHLIESGPFEVHIAHTFPLNRADEAHRELDTHFLGKLVLLPGKTQ